MPPNLESLHYIGHTGRQVSHSQAVGCCCYCCQLQSPAVLLVGCLASSAEERVTRGQFWWYNVFLLFLTREQQHHCKGSLHPPWHPLTAAVSWSATKDTLCITGFCPSSSTPNRKHFRDWICFHHHMYRLVGSYTAWSLQKANLDLCMSEFRILDNGPEQQQRQHII